MKNWCTSCLYATKISEKSIKNVFVNASEEAIDLLKRILTFNPKKRITVDEALEHCYFKDLRQPEQEIVFDSKIDIEITDKLKSEILEYKENYFNGDKNLEEGKTAMA